MNKKIKREGYVGGTNLPIIKSIETVKFSTSEMNLRNDKYKFIKVPPEVYAKSVNTQSSAVPGILKKHNDLKYTTGSKTVPGILKKLKDP